MKSLHVHHHELMSHLEDLVGKHVTLYFGDFTRTSGTLVELKDQAAVLLRGQNPSTKIHYHTASLLEVVSHETRLIVIQPKRQRLQTNRLRDHHA